MTCDGSCLLQHGRTSAALMQAAAAWRRGSSCLEMGQQPNSSITTTSYLTGLIAGSLMDNPDVAAFATEPCVQAASRHVHCSTAWQEGANRHSGVSFEKTHCNWSGAMAVIGQYPGQALSVGLRNLAGCLLNALACMSKVGKFHCLAGCGEQSWSSASCSMAAEPPPWLPSQ